MSATSSSSNGSGDVESPALQNPFNLAPQTLGNLIDLVNDLVWMLSGDGRHLLYMNAAAASVYGSARDELRLRPELWLGAVHPQDKPFIREHLSRIDALRSFSHRFRVLNASGIEIWLDAQFQLLPSDVPTTELIGVVAKDITEHIRAERELDEARAIYETLVQNVPIKVFRKDQSGRLVFCNQLYCQALGRPLDELIGKTDYDLFPKDLADKYVADDARVLATGQPMHDIEQHPGPQGQMTYVEVLKAPVADAQGRRSGIQGMFWDVTSRVLAEQELQRSRDVAEAASKAKGDFLANVSHEIRTPMNAIIGITELLTEGCRDKQQREYLAMIQQSGENLMTLLNDILDFSKIEAGKLELESLPIDLRERLGDTMRSLAIRAHAKDLELVLDIDPELPQLVMGDINRIRQVMINLVSNAIKFTSTGEVIVRIECPHRADDMAHLTFDVIDSGIGIAANRVESIFHEFEQADTATARQYGGTGLGLPITRRLVELMGGTLQVKSQVGFGSQFHFELELPYREQPQLAAEEILSSLRDLRVLVVENHVATTRAIARQLEAWKISAEFATSSEQARFSLTQSARHPKPFDAVLIDATLDGNSSLNLARWIRKQEALVDTKLVLMTSSQSMERAARELDLDRMIKPIKPSDLLETLAAVLGIDTREQDATPEPGNRSRSLNILVAEDNEINQRLTAAILKKMGHRVTVVSNGTLAVDTTRRQRFDLILMDVQMPVQDGLQATQEIRRHEKPGAHLPIIALSAHVTDEFRQMCLAAGMDDYLTKPMRRDKLAAAIEQLTGIRSALLERTDDVPAVRKIDWQHAFETVAGDRALLVELILVFLRDREQMLAEVEQAVQAKDWRLLRRSAHSLRGALGHLGAKSAAELAGLLEGLAQEENEGEVVPLWKRFQDELSELTAELERFTTN